MNIGLILAAGIGQRMGFKIPKQFVLVNDKTILEHTMDIFQKSEDIDFFYVVIHKNWQKFCKKNFTNSYDKFQGLIFGGETGQESIKKGIDFLFERHDKKSIIVIHDSIRPNLNLSIIKEGIDVCKNKGNSVTTLKSNEAMLVSNDGSMSEKYLNRDLIFRTQTPQCVNLGLLKSLHDRAILENITNLTATCNLLIKFGIAVNFVQGSILNLKLTTPEDMFLFKAIKGYLND